MFHRTRSSISAAAGLIIIALVASSAAMAQCNLTDTFDGGFDQPWVKTDPSYVRAENDVLSVMFVSPDPDTYHGIVLDPCVYTDLRTGVRMRDLDETRGKAIAFRNNGIYIGYNVNVRSFPYNDVVLGKGSFSPAAILALAPLPNATGEWIEVEVEAVGPRITVWVNGEQVIDYEDPQPILRGWSFLGINAGGTHSAHAEFDDFWVVNLDSAIPVTDSSMGMLKGRF